MKENTSLPVDIQWKRIPVLFSITACIKKKKEKDPGNQQIVLAVHCTEKGKSLAKYFHMSTEPVNNT